MKVCGEGDGRGRDSPQDLVLLSLVRADDVIAHVEDALVSSALFPVPKRCGEGTGKEKVRE